ncbi:ABC transporter substrate-binding protein [Cohnella lupini]|uniref:Carbohydrate ABC transporter substrate-binding protein (CUT1 family) n=1 Tax=Cohnella lupini TaxID=1294267 RepID=A0A3D9IX32_9BACL|nr:ABC transporter substrate-binding protein [Cohnella lupini]RED66368.1 carbohydrate ABC transporter substrate-binding protein (CUT1 family) [Cohnella lupini]
MKRMTNMKSSLGLILITAMMVLILAACGNSANDNSGNNAAASSTPPASESASAPASSEPASTEKTTIQFWHSLSGKNAEYMDALLKRFNDSHPNIEVVGTFQGTYDETVTKLQQSIASNTGPDVTMLERAYVEMFADADALEDMNPMLTASGMSQDDFIPGLMGHSVFNDKLLALPLNRSTPILHVNKTLLDAKGIAIPTNWDEMKKAANALVVKSGNEVTQYGLTMPYDTWYPIAMITQDGGKFFSDDKKTIDFFDNGIGEDVFGYLKDLQKSGALFYPPTQDSGTVANQLFTSGKVAMMFQSTGSIGGLASEVDFDYVTAFLPQNKQYANPTGGGNVAMLASSKNKEAAWEFIRWLETDPQGSLAFILQSGYLPFTKAMSESKEIQDLWAKEPNRKVAFDQLQYAVDTNKSVVWPEVMNEFNSAIQAIMYDSKDIKSTLATFKKEAERILGQ